MRGPDQHPKPNHELQQRNKNLPLSTSTFPLHLIFTFTLFLHLFSPRLLVIPAIERQDDEERREENEPAPRVWVSIFKLVVGLGVLIGSSHFLVWGAVDFAKFCGVSDLVIGLTIVAAGTSLPELASAVASARRGEHEFVLGTIIGSNLFNTLAVVGLATVISPLVPGPNGEPAFSRYVLTRDLPLMTALSLSIMFFGINWKHPKWPGAIQRKEAWAWILVFVAYTLLMFYQETHG